MSITTVIITLTSKANGTNEGVLSTLFLPKIVEKPIYKNFSGKNGKFFWEKYCN